VKILNISGRLSMIAQMKKTDLFGKIVVAVIFKQSPIRI